MNQINSLKHDPIVEEARKKAVEIAISSNPDHLKDTIIENSIHWTARDIQRIINPPQWHKCMG